MFSVKSWTREIYKQYSEPASFHQPASFSPLAPVVLNPENPVADQPKTLPTPKQPVIADQQTSQEEVSLAVSENQKDETKVSSEVEAGSAFNPATENNVNPEPASIEDDDDCNLITEAPSWREIMDRVYQRSAGAEDGSISLTISEIGSLLCDDDFFREKPELGNSFTGFLRSMMLEKRMAHNLSEIGYRE